MRHAVRVLALLPLFSGSAFAQGRGAMIAGVVLDSAMQPLAGADVIARPGEHRVRSDSLGRFTLTGLDGGNYVVAARKVGFAPDRWDVALSRNGRSDVRFVLQRRLELDTVVVTARSNCELTTITGFMCRRRIGGGLFLDYPEIDELGARETADLFRKLPEFRVDIQPTSYGLALGTLRDGVLLDDLGAVRRLKCHPLPSPTSSVSRSCVAAAGSTSRRSRTTHSKVSWPSPRA